MIDFAALTLAPAMAVFARPVIVTPVKSQKGAPPYPARGIVTARMVDIPNEVGIQNSRLLTLGIALSDFAVPPAVKDVVEIPAHLGLPAEGEHWIEDIDLDGQGGAKLILKKGKR